MRPVATARRGGPWRQFWRRAPRQLRFTRDGKIITGIALAVGFAAINTGNNLLFLAWGLVLSAIVVSGVLSEAALRILAVRLERPVLLRVGEVARLPWRLENRSRWLPSFALDLRVTLSAAGVRRRGRAPLVLRLGPRVAQVAATPVTPAHRGRQRCEALSVRTRYPFGFFEKSRRFEVDGELWAAPRHVDVAALLPRIAARIGQATMARPGRGDEFFGLRGYRHGDDLRRIAWRKSARTGRWVVVEEERMAARELVVELDTRALGGSEAVREHAIAVLGSVAEALLDQGYRVGVRAAGLALAPDVGPGQLRAVMEALARLDAGRPMPPIAFEGDIARVAIGVGPGADCVLPLEVPAPESAA